MYIIYHTPFFEPFRVEGSVSHPSQEAGSTKSLLPATGDIQDPRTPSGDLVPGAMRDGVCRTFLQIYAKRGAELSLEVLGP